MKTNIKYDFLIYAIEEYKYFENKIANEIIELFSKYNVFDYIINNYESLHTIGGRAIADDINLYIENHKKL